MGKKQSKRKSGREYKSISIKPREHRPVLGPINLPKNSPPDCDPYNDSFSRSLFSQDLFLHQYLNKSKPSPYKNDYQNNLKTHLKIEEIINQLLAANQALFERIEAIKEIKNYLENNKNFDFQILNKIRMDRVFSILFIF